jgi:hypothetical protein
MTGHNIDRTDAGATCTCGDTFTGATPNDLWHAVIAHLRTEDLAGHGVARQKALAAGARPPGRAIDLPIGTCHQAA